MALSRLRLEAQKERERSAFQAGQGTQRQTTQSAAGQFPTSRLKLEAQKERERAQASPSVTTPVAASPAQGGTSTMIGLDSVVRANAVIAQTKKELSDIQAQIDELEAGLDLDGAAQIYNTTYAAKKRQLKEQEAALKQAMASTSTGAQLAQLKQRQDELTAGLDLDGASALQPEIERLKNQSKMEGYAGKAYTDDFTGQFSASMAVGRLQQEEAKAWGDYASAPTQENRERAQSMSAILERVQMDNARTLDEDATLPWLSQSLAGYLPQFWDQTKARVGGAATGAAFAAMTPWTAPFVGKAAKAGATVATGLQSYQVMRGRAFKELLDLGVDEETARKAANDEAVISAMIEMAETGIDLFVGLGSLIKGGGKVTTEAAKPAVKKLLTLLGKYGLGKYGLNVGTEWLEEGSQQAVSIANRERAAQGETGKVNLAAGTGDVLIDILLGRNKEAAKEVVGAGNEGAKIAAMMGLPGMAGNVATSRVINSDPLVTALFGKPTQQATQETTQEATPNAAGERTAIQTGTDTTQAESPAQGQRTVVQEAVAAASRVGDITSKSAEMLAKDPAALRELGIDPNGKTSAHLRAEVKTAVPQRATAENAQEQTAQPEQTPETAPAEGAQERDPLMTALFGEESTQSSTPTDVENGAEFDIAGENGYNEGKRSKEASLVIDRLNSGERVDVKEIMRIPEVAIAEQANKGTPTIDLPGRENIRNNAFNQAMQTGSFTGKDYSGPVKQERRMDIVIGLPGSGKSSVYTERISQENGSRVIDTDDYRGYIPEYNGINAAIVHEEAASIKDQVLDAALDRGDNIILSTIGANADRLAAQIKAYAADGYSVYLHLNELSGHKAMARAISRFIGENGELGRFVSPELISSYGDKPTQTYLILTGQGGSYGEDLDAGLPGGRGSGGTENTGDAQTQGRKTGYAEGLTGWDWYNNDVEYGQPPKLIQSSDKGELSGTPTPTQESGHTNTVGAAQAGFLTPDSVSVERESAQRKNWPMTKARQEAGAYTREEWNEVFKYMTRPEAQSMQEAHNLLYMQKGALPSYISMETDDGPVVIEKEPETVFLGDIDPEGLQELMDYLKNAPAWTDAMTDTAMLLEAELVGRSRVDAADFYGEGAFLVDDGTYREWVQTIRDKRTTAGQALQAGAKWNREDNSGGMSSRQEALDALEESGLSEQEQKNLFDDICGFDVEIERAQTDSALIDIILRIAQKRGTTNGITGKQSKRLVKRARKSLESLTTDELRQFAYASSAAMATDPSPADAGAKVKAIQVLNMLSNPRTADTNIAGNTTFYGIDALALQGAALVDMAVSKLTGTRSVAMERFVWNKQGRADIAKALRMSAAEITLDVDMGGTEGRYGQTSRRTFKSGGTGVFGTGNTVDRFFERALSAAERNMGYALTTTDEGYKGAARSTARATQKLVGVGKIKTENKDYATEQADELAKYRTFQSEGRVISTAIQGLHDLFNIIGFGKKTSVYEVMGHKVAVPVHSFGVGDLAAPFVRVAGNLVSTAIDYSPAKAAQGLGEIVTAVVDAKRNGSVDPAKQAKAVSDFARGMAGTGVALGAWAFAKSGVLKRADDEDDEDVAALNQTEGMTGTQLNLNAMGRLLSGGDPTWQNGDTLVDLSRLEPLSFLLSLGVEFAKDEEDDGFFSTWGEPQADMGRAFTAAAGDLPVMGTIGGVAKDHFVYGDPLEQAIIENLGKTAISSVTPNIMAAAAKGLDDKQRSTYSGEGVRDVLIDTLLSRIPGARQTLPTVVNTLGEEKDNPGNLGVRLFNSMLNPIGVNEYSQSEVSQEMERVREKTGETSFYPSKSIPSELAYTDKNDKKHTATLNYEQKQKYQVARSGAQMSVSAAMLGNPLYRKSDAKTQAALLEQVHKYANEYARGQVLGKDSMGKWALNSQTAQKDLGMSQTDYLYYYVKYGGDVMSGAGYDATKRMVKAGLTVDQWVTMKNSVDTNGNDSVSKAETMNYIERNFPRARWRTLFEAYKGNRTWDNPY